MLKVAVSILGRGCTDLYCKAIRWYILPMRVGVTASQFDLLSLPALSITGCDRLLLGVTHWATSVALLQVVDN